MVDIFLTEIPESGNNRVRSCLAERAEAGDLHVFRQLLDPVELLQSRLALGDVVEHLQETVRSDPAGHTFAAGFLAGEFQIELRDIHHTGVFVHDDQSAGAHHGTDLREALVVDRCVNMDRRNTAAGRTAGLRRLEPLAIGNASADLFDDLAERCAHGDFHQADVRDLAAEGEHLGALGGLGTDRGIPLRSLEDDLGDVGIGLDVVEDGRLPEETFHSRERRPRAGLSALAFDGGHQRRLLAADESAGAETDLDVKIKSGSKDVLTQEPVLPGLFERDLQTLNSDWILGADIHIALAGADREACNGHCLDDGMGIALKDGAVHEGAGVALVRVAADILDVALGRFTEGPFAAGREPRAAAAAQAGGQNGIDDLVLIHRCQNLVQRQITVQSDILLNVLRVDDAAVFERDTHLFCIEIGLGKRKDLAVCMYRLRIQQILADHALDDVLVNDPPGAFRSSLGIERALRIHDHDRAQRTETEAAGPDHEDVGQVLLLYLALERVYNLFTA